MRLCLAFAVLALLLAPAAAAADPAAPGDPAVPRVEFAFPRLIERYCAEVSTTPPREAVLDEIARRLPELVAAWERDGPARLADNVRLTGHPFRFAETQAVLHGCEDLSSMSQPLLIFAARYTDAWAAAPAPGGAPRTRRGPEEFVNAVWHEVTHRYIGAILAALPGGSTPIRERHSAESLYVRNHLHLFALEELIWTQAGRRAEFEARRSRILAQGDPQMARAYRLAMEEGAEPLVAELRATAR